MNTIFFLPSLVSDGKTGNEEILWFHKNGAKEFFLEKIHEAKYLIISQDVLVLFQKHNISLTSGQTIIVISNETKQYAANIFTKKNVIAAKDFIAEHQAKKQLLEKCDDATVVIIGTKLFTAASRQADELHGIFIPHAERKNYTLHEISLRNWRIEKAIPHTIHLDRYGGTSCILRTYKKIK